MTEPKQHLERLAAFAAEWAKFRSQFDVGEGLPGHPPLTLDDLNFLIQLAQQGLEQSE